MSNYSKSHYQKKQANQNFQLPQINLEIWAHCQLPKADPGSHFSFTFVLPKWLKHHNCKDQLSVQETVRKIMYRNIRILQNIFNLSVHCSNLSSDKTADEQQYRLSQSAPAILFLNKHEGMQQRLNLRKNCSLTVHLRSIDLASQICTLLKAQENHCSIFEKPTFSMLSSLQFHPCCRWQGEVYPCQEHC